MNISFDRRKTSYYYFPLIHYCFGFCARTVAVYSIHVKKKKTNNSGQIEQVQNVPNMYTLWFILIQNQPIVMFVLLQPTSPKSTTVSFLG